MTSLTLILVLRLTGAGISPVYKGKALDGPASTINFFLDRSNCSQLHRNTAPHFSHGGITGYWYWQLPDRERSKCILRNVPDNSYLIANWQDGYDYPFDYRDCNPFLESELTRLKM